MRFSVGDVSVQGDHVGLRLKKEVVFERFREYEGLEVVAVSEMSAGTFASALDLPRNGLSNVDDAREASRHRSSVRPRSEHLPSLVLHILGVYPQSRQGYEPATFYFPLGDTCKRWICNMSILCCRMPHSLNRLWPTKAPFTDGPCSRRFAPQPLHEIDLVLPLMVRVIVGQLLGSLVIVAVKMMRILYVRNPVLARIGITQHAITIPEN